MAADREQDRAGFFITDVDVAAVHFVAQDCNYLLLSRLLWSTRAERKRIIIDAADACELFWVDRPIVCLQRQLLEVPHGVLEELATETMPIQLAST